MVMYTTCKLFLINRVGKRNNIHVNYFQLIKLVSQRTYVYMDNNLASQNNGKERKTAGKRDIRQHTFTRRASRFSTTENSRFGTSRFSFGEKEIRKGLTTRRNN